MIRLIDGALLETVSQRATINPRRRQNFNFHPTEDFPGHRLLNAIEPDSYVMPHRHLDPIKDESMVILRGRLGLLIFDDAGAVTRTAILAPATATVGADIPHGTWHAVLALDPGTVFFEAKSGPYRPLNEAECASWAPHEGDAAVADYLLELRALFDASAK